MNDDYCEKLKAHYHGMTDREVRRVAADHRNKGVRRNALDELKRRTRDHRKPAEEEGETE